MKARVSKSGWIALGVMLVGAVLRVYHLGAQSLWLDELFSVAVARGNWSQVFIGTIQGDTNPPLFNLLLHLGLEFGNDETAARLVSLVFGVGVLPVFYWLVRDLLEVRVALIALAIVALNPFQIFYTQEARMYAQLAFFCVSAFFFFERAWFRLNRAAWLMFALAMILAFYTHSLAVLNLIAIDIFALTQPAILRRQWRSLAAAHLIIGILFAPWGLIMLDQMRRVASGFWGAAPSPFVFFTTPYVFIFGGAIPPTLVPLALFVLVAFLFLTLFALARVWRPRDPQSINLGLIVCISIVPMIALYLISLVRPIYIERTLIPASFGWYALFAWLIAQTKPRGFRIALGIVLFSSLSVALYNYYYNSDLAKPAMREAAQALVAHYQRGDAIAHTSDSSALAFAYYAPQLSNVFLAGDPDYVNPTTRGNSGRISGLVPQDVDSIIVDHSRVWLIVALDHNVEYQLGRAQEFDARFGAPQKINVQGIQLLLYQK